jgi:DNA mismatch repair protein PMS2
LTWSQNVVAWCRAGAEAVARSVGTTVAVTDLFKTLPVRYKAFLRGVKKEYIKLVSVVQAYALIRTSVKIVATNQVTRREHTT